MKDCQPAAHGELACGKEGGFGTGRDQASVEQDALKLLGKLRE